MECVECQKRPATLHFSQVVNGQKTTVHLCDICAKNKGYVNNDDTYSLHELLTGLFHFAPSQINLQKDNFFETLEELKCERCQLTFSEFQRIGKFGCSNCYETFKVKLNSIIRRVHSGNTAHFGKVPKRKGKKIHELRELARYKEKLKELIAEENFEEAAVIRDIIRGFDSDGKGGST